MDIPEPNQGLIIRNRSQSSQLLSHSKSDVASIHERFSRERTRYIPRWWASKTPPVENPDTLYARYLVSARSIDCKNLATCIATVKTKWPQIHVEEDGDCRQYPNQPDTEEWYDRYIVDRVLDLKSWNGVEYMHVDPHGNFIEETSPTDT